MKVLVCNALKKKLDDFLRKKNYDHVNNISILFFIRFKKVIVVVYLSNIFALKDLESVNYSHL